MDDVKKEWRERKRLKRKAIVVMTALSLFLMQNGAFAASSSVMFASSSAGVSTAADTADFEKPAEPKITKDEAVAKVRSLFPQLAGAQVQDVQLGNPNRYPPGNPNVWTIQWNYTKGTSSYGFNSAVDSLTGELLETSLFYPFDEGNEVYYPPKVSKEDALKLAKAFIGKAAPALPAGSLAPSDQMKYYKQALFGPVRYDFNFNVFVNGIKSSSEVVYVSMDGNGQVVSYHRNKFAGAYPPAAPKLSMDQARQKYFDAADLMLQYIPVYDSNSRDKTWFLGWAPPLLTEMSVDAETGEILNGFGEAIQPKEVKYLDIPAAGSVFAPAKGTGAGSLLTADEAAAAVQKVLRIPENRSLSSSILDRNEYGMSGTANRKIWRLQWSEQMKSPSPYPKQTTASVDAQTGQLLEFTIDGFRPIWQESQDEDQDKVQATINKEQAKAKAMQLINELYPDARLELLLVDPDPSAIYKEPKDSITFVFQRYYDGKPVVDDSVRLTLDASGQLIGYNVTRSGGLEKSAATLTARVSKDKAAELYRDQTSYVLQYRVYGGFYTEREFVKPKLKLVYIRENKNAGDPNRYVLDASNGQWRTTFTDTASSGEAPMVYPKDIKGHWAQKDLETLVQYQILKLDSDGMLKPDDAITLGDWINMMAYAVNPGYVNSYSYRDSSDASGQFRDVDAKSPYYAASQWFIQNKWLDPVKTPVLKPEQPLTRELLAELLVSIVKYNKLAGYLQQPLPFKDANQITNKGAVAIAVSLGLFSREADKFYPKHKVTKAQAATVLMNLVRLQGKLDQRIT
ncbi:hypothetical protein E5161_15525 [Cohnella pontilimi]|uniref:SLH domain-containing protein n=1 Tax=Cohnella pontilimi TaxID=2564100 RepID=A0A4U0F8N9_9BACL|nr:S-layer homology domain-containing protein [Cohnella pontilimi]TJY41106.1 hypothetical protein E5161_15525 [Cohnella pontilimi]